MKFTFCSLLIITFSFHLLGQGKEFPLSEMIKLIPDKVKGYLQEDDSKSKQIQIGTLTYSICEKTFVSGARSIKILLFDYRYAPIMYIQAMGQWNNFNIIESDSLILRHVSNENYEGWESYNRKRSSSRIFLGVCNRFFLNVAGENVNLDELKQVVNTIPLNQFPK